MPFVVTSNDDLVAVKSWGVVMGYDRETIIDRLEKATASEPGKAIVIDHQAATIDITTEEAFSFGKKIQQLHEARPHSKICIIASPENRAIVDVSVAVAVNLGCPISVCDSPDEAKERISCP